MFTQHMKTSHNSKIPFFVTEQLTTFEVFRYTKVGLIMHIIIRGDQVTYPHKPLSKIKVAICNHKVDRTNCGLMSAVVICKEKEYGYTVEPVLKTTCI